VSEFAKAISDVVKARDAITEKLGKWKKGRQGDEAGEIPCPVCRAGRLHFMRSSYNGHVHASCTTPACVRWME
jgi:hypothetical protein